MKEFIHELIIIGTSIGTLICREIIVILKKYITTPKHVRSYNKMKKHENKLNKQQIKLEKLMVKGKNKEVT